jgi:CTP:molybdopterin cytidylyltransferase MocA
MIDEESLCDGFVAIVLAGGLSERMGRNKLLMDISGRPMIRHVVEVVRGSVPEVVVVTGHQGERVMEALARLPVTAVHADPAGGQGASIALALQAIEAAVGTLVCVGDQPRLTEREIAGLVETYLASDRLRVVMPVRQGRRGFPIVVPPGFDAGTVDLAADDLADTHPDRVAMFETRNPVYESSVDTPQDYRALFAL